MTKPGAAISAITASRAEGPLRVVSLMALPTFTGAAEPAVDLVTSLLALGVDVSVRFDTHREGNLAQILRARAVSFGGDLVLSTKAGPLAWLSDLLRLRRLLRDVDVVHTHLSHDHALAALAARLQRRRPLIVRSVHSARVLEPTRGRRFLLGLADGVTVASEEDRAKLLGQRGLAPNRVLVLPGAVDPSRFHPDSAARERFRPLLRLSARDFAVGCVARFQAGRRHEVLLDAVGVARALRPDLAIRLVLVGHGERESWLRSRVEADAALSEAVVFAGYRRDDLNDCLAALDAAAWLVPGNDATSRAVLQAMAVGLPVIGGRLGAIREAVLEGETGLLADPDDPHDVARALVALAADPRRALALGEAGRCRALTTYSPLSRARRLLDFYASLRGEPGPSLAASGQLR